MIIAKITRIQDTDTGYIFHLDTDNDLYDVVPKFIEDEQSCCGFLNFEVTAEEGLQLRIETRRSDRIDQDKDFILNGLMSEDLLD